jgi:hypothetical protein
VGDAAELGAHAGGVDHGARLSGNDRGAGEDDVLGLQWRLLAARLGVRALASDSPVTVDRLTRKPKASVSRQSAGTKSPFFEQHDVARYQFAGEKADDLAGAQRFHLLRQQLAQRGHRPFGLVFLPEREDAVDEDHADDGHAEAGHSLAGVEMLGDERKAGADPQDDGEEVGEFLREAQQQVLLLDLFEEVGTELGRAGAPPRRRSGPAAEVFRLASACSTVRA